MKYLAWLIPLGTIWILFCAGHLLIDFSKPPEWWGIPAMLTGIAVFATSVIVACIISDRE